MNVAVARRYAACLWLLTALFTFRVIAQPLSLVVSADYLPPFEAWHSGAMPYGVLVVAQLAILIALGAGAWRMSSATVRPSRRLGVGIVWLGVTYFAAMMLRLALGATILRDHGWFGRPVPTIFHLVLGSYVILYGHFHVRHGSSR